MVPYHLYTQQVLLNRNTLSYIPDILVPTAEPLAAISVTAVESFDRLTTRYVHVVKMFSSKYP